MGAVIQEEFQQIVVVVVFVAVAVLVLDIEHHMVLGETTKQPVVVVAVVLVQEKTTHLIHLVLIHFHFCTICISCRLVYFPITSYERQRLRHNFVRKYWVEIS